MPNAAKLLAQEIKVEAINEPIVINDNTSFTSVLGTTRKRTTTTDDDENDKDAEEWEEEEDEWEEQDDEEEEDYD